MTMKRINWICALVLAGCLFPGMTKVQAATRINGNQMVEGLGSWGFAYRANAQSAQAASVDMRTYRMYSSLGQGVVAQGTLPDSVVTAGGNISLAIGVGLAYDILRYNPVACPVPLTGDVNVDGLVDLEDIIYMVNHVYKSGAVPQPCLASGDVNCTGNLTSSDLTYLINYIFQAGPAPCDACELIPGTWPCP